MNVEKAREITKEAIEELSHQLERGRSDMLKAYLAAMAKLPRYSLHNLLLIMAQHPGAQQCAGLKTWNRLGRYVRKGEHGIAILAPCVRRRTCSVESAQSKRGLWAEYGDDNLDGVVIGFRGVYVFDVSQTDGAPLPQPACVDGDPGIYFHRLTQAIADRGIQLSYSPAIAPAHGVSTRNHIILRPDLSPAERFATAAHELGHVLLEHHKPNDPAANAALHETEAEAVAYVVCQAIGLDTNTAAADYIAFHQGGTRTLVASLERIQKTAAQIVAAIGPDV